MLIQDISESVIKMLVTQDQRFQTGDEKSAAISMTQLRDFFLHDIKPASKRNVVWKKVNHLLNHSSFLNLIDVVCDRFVTKCCIIVALEKRAFWWRANNMMHGNG